MSTMNDNLLIVRLHQRKWSPWGYDKEAAKEVAEREGAKKEDTHVTKRKISKEAIQDVLNVMAKAYIFHTENTMPSGTEGTRLIPVEMLQKYTEKMDEFNSQMNSALDRFVAEYPQWVEEARIRLQGLFKEEDYPSSSEIRLKFSQTYHFLPLPSVDHISFKLLNSQREKIKESVEKELKNIQKVAMKDLWDRIYTNVAHMAERLGSDKRLFSSVIDNVKNMCEVLKSLNFANDPELEAMRQRVESRLTGHDPEELRKFRNIREDVAREAKAIAVEISEKRKLRIE